MLSKGLHDESEGSDSAPSDDDLKLSEYHKILPRVHAKPQQAQNKGTLSKQLSPSKVKPASLAGGECRQPQKPSQKSQSTRQSPDKALSPKKSVAVHPPPLKAKLYPSINIKEFKLQMNNSPQNIFAKRFCNAMRSRELSEQRQQSQFYQYSRNLMIDRGGGGAKPIHVKNIVIEGQYLHDILSNSSIIEQQKELFEKIFYEQTQKQYQPQGSQPGGKKDGIQIPRLYDIQAGNAADAPANKPSFRANLGQNLGSNSNLASPQQQNREDQLYQQYQDTRILSNPSQAPGSGKNVHHAKLPGLTDLPQLYQAQTGATASNQSNGNSPGANDNGLGPLEHAPSTRLEPDATSRPNNRGPGNAEGLYRDLNLQNSLKTKRALSIDNNNCLGLPSLQLQRELQQAQLEAAELGTGCRKMERGAPKQPKASELGTNLSIQPGRAPPQKQANAQELRSRDTCYGANGTMCQQRNNFHHTQMFYNFEVQDRTKAQKRLSCKETPSQQQYNNQTKKASLGADLGGGCHQVDSKGNLVGTSTLVNFSQSKQSKDIYNMLNANQLVRQLLQEKKKSQQQQQYKIFVSNNQLLKEVDETQAQLQNKRHFTQPNEQSQLSKQELRNLNCDE